ncbi:MAG TPA: class I SAM-dependent methyltransferase [Chthoniobacterales bacterium]|nr:class I SAM-dependent methyltransferase [Chthoniobacterales bacterium]
MTYDQQIASDYAQLREVHRPLLAALITGPGIKAGCRVLELGCGTGNYIRAIQSQTGCSAWGVDPSPEMLSQAKIQGRLIIWKCATAENPGLTSIQFDFIFNVDAIHYFQDCALAFSEVHRLLSDTGTFCIATDSEEIIRNRKPLSTYWPETIELELARYPRIDTLEVELREAGLLNLRQEEVCTTGWLGDLSAYRAKAFSALRLLPEDAYQRGLRRMETDLAKGPISSTCRYLLVWAKR